MPDREKVIKGLSCCAKWMEENDTDACDSCPYHPHYCYVNHRCLEEVNNDAISLLKEQPEIVRCKDCVFRDARDGMCEHVQQMRDPDWYCADGERRDNDG